MVTQESTVRLKWMCEARASHKENQLRITNWRSSILSIAVIKCFDQKQFRGRKVLCYLMLPCYSLHLTQLAFLYSPGGQMPRECPSPLHRYFHGPLWSRQSLHWDTILRRLWPVSSWQLKLNGIAGLHQVLNTEILALWK